jgi:alkylation response protein AidB-like acyl-CoA dehydrogenase
MMAAALRELLNDLCSAQALRAVFDGDHSAAEHRWRRLAELGLFGVLAPQGAGGMGLADADFVLLAEEGAVRRCPSRSRSRRLLRFLLAEVASEAAAALLPALASGEAVWPLPCAESLCGRRPGCHALVTVFGGCADVGERRGVEALPARSVDAGRRLFEPRLRPAAAGCS